LVKFVWPLLVFGVGLAVPFVGSFEFVRALDRFKHKHPQASDEVSAEDLTRAEPRAWLLPVGVLILGPVLILAGMAWFLWVLISEALGDI
jgi:hypothetical protein